MKRKIAFLFALLLSVLFICVGCSGGGGEPTTENPGSIHADKLPPGIDGTTSATPTMPRWDVYQPDNGPYRQDTIYIWSEKMDNATFVININNYKVKGSFTWESKDNGNNITAKVMNFPDGNPMNLPTTGTIHDFKSKEKSYILYNGKRYNHFGVASSRS